MPSSGVGAVLLDLSAVDPDAASYFTVWPAGASRSGTSTALWDGTVSATGLEVDAVGLVRS